MLQARHTMTIAATKAHCRLAFSAQPQRFFLSLLVGLYGSTDTTARKSSIEEKMFWKVTLPSTFIFSAKDVCTINVTVSFYLYLYLKPRGKCFIFRRWVTLSWQPPLQALHFSQGRGERLVMSRKGPWEGYRRQAKPARCLLPAFLCARERDVWIRGSDRDIIFRDETDLVFCFLGCVVTFPARESNSWRRRASSHPGNWVCVFFSFFFPSYRFCFFYDQTHTLT